MKKYKVVATIFSSYFKPTDTGTILHETDEPDIYEYVSQYGNSKTPDSKIRLIPETLNKHAVEIKDSISLTDILWRELKDMYFHVGRLQSFDKEELKTEWQDYQMKLIKESQGE